MTRIIVEVARDGDGRLHGTVEPDGPDVSRADFTGVIELVATIEATLDRVAPELDHQGRADPA